MSGAGVQRICTFRNALFRLHALFLTAFAAGETRSPDPLASARVPSDRQAQYYDTAVRWMQEYLRMDTTNPPGNELRAATFFKTILDQEGIENRIFEYQPGRANLWARLPHASGTAKRPIILLNHMDVVTSDASRWKVPPFSGQVVDGAIYGRCAQDMKNEGLAQLVVMVVLKREKAVLDRDVILFGGQRRGGGRYGHRLDDCQPARIVGER